jgi:hypothetical protein
LKTSGLVLLTLAVAAAGGCSPVSDPVFEATATTAIEAAPSESTQITGTNTPAASISMTPTTSLTPDLLRLPQVGQAKADLAQRLSVGVDDIEVVTVEAVEWPDGSFGCPQPGMAYAQVIQEGLQILLRYGGRDYDYHSGGAQKPFLCENQVGIIKSTPAIGGATATVSDPDY